MANVRGDSVPIKKYKTKKHPKGEYMPYPYGPSQFPQAKKKNVILDAHKIWKG